VDEARLRLSDTVRQFLSTDLMKDIENADAETSTIEALLSHRSGIESWEDDPVWIANGRGRLLDPKKIWTRTEALDYIRHPGSKTPRQYSHSNTNYTLLGLIIEKITHGKAEIQIRKPHPRAPEPKRCLSRRVSRTSISGSGVAALPLGNEDVS
jgi:D-alanyl-D-alanine carboxypeptidase